MKMMKGVDEQNQPGNVGCNLVNHGRAINMQDIVCNCSGAVEPDKRIMVLYN